MLRFSQPLPCSLRWCLAYSPAAPHVSAITPSTDGEQRSFFLTEHGEGLTCSSPLDLRPRISQPHRPVEDQPPGRGILRVRAEIALALELEAGLGRGAFQ